ncbi:MAG TPA: ATP-binding protein [Stellaceae bacterium]|nr:ATP-binding protein [Stellaceae bacterium]
MNFVKALSPSNLPSRGLHRAGVFLIVATIVAAILASWSLRRHELKRTRSELANLGLVLAQDMTRTLQTVDLVLKKTRMDLLASAAADPQLFERQMGSAATHGNLVAEMKNLPETQAIALIGADGRLVNSSRFWPVPDVDFSQIRIYRYLRANDDGGVAVAGPAIARLTGVPSFYLARRIDGPGGVFRGMVVAVFEIPYFERFFGRITVSPGGSVALFRRDGRLLGRYPQRPELRGRKLAAQSPWYAAVKAGGGTFYAPGTLTGIRRIVSVQPLEGFPLVVSTSVTEDAALAPWRRQSVPIALGALCAVIGFAVLFHALARQSKRLEEQAAELAQTADALRDSEEYFRDFALVSSDWFWETDESHRFSFTSDHVRKFGQNPEYRVGRTRRQLAADADADPEKWEAHFKTLERHEPFRDFVYTRRVGNDEERVIAVSGKPVFDRSGRFVGYRGTGRDITREVTAERALREAKTAAETANRAKSQFLANISHELRTPLNAILGFAEMLGKGLAGPVSPRQREYADFIYQGGAHLLHVINDILDLVRVDAGRLELREEDGVDPRRIAEASLALVRERAESGAVSLSCEIEDEAPLVVADPTRLTQILINLLSNAVKFTDSGGSVVLMVRRSEEGGLDFAVRDTGSGMTPAEIEIALEPFGQVDSSLARRHEGAGLGLPLARRLAELHGAELRIESEKGRGTTVTLRLPNSRVIAVPKPEVAGEKPPALARGWARYGKESIGYRGRE